MLKSAVLVCGLVLAMAAAEVLEDIEAQTTESNATQMSLPPPEATQQEALQEDAENGAACNLDAAPSDATGAAELSVLSGHNASGHWVAKVRLQHAAEEQPVHLQLQRSAQQRPGGARTIALEATLSGSSSPRSEDSTTINEVLHCPKCPFPAPNTPCSVSRECPVCPTAQPCPECPLCPTAQPCPECPPLVTCPDCPSPCPAVMPAAKRIPPGYVFRQDLGYYRFHTVPVTWFEAKDTCEREGAHLIIINSQEEAKMVTSFLQELDIPIIHHEIRVGLHDLVVEGKFFTVLGQPIASTGFAEWRPNEPNDARGIEDCVSLIANKLNDISCDSKGTFVCELPN